MPTTAAAGRAPLSNPAPTPAHHPTEGWFCNACPGLNEAKSEACEFCGVSRPAPLPGEADLRTLLEFVRTHASTSSRAHHEIHLALDRVSAAARLGYQVGGLHAGREVTTPTEAPVESTEPEATLDGPVPPGVNRGSWDWLVYTTAAVRRARAEDRAAAERFGLKSVEAADALGRYREAQDAYRHCVLHPAGEELVRALLARVQGMAGDNTGDLTPLIDLFRGELAEEGRVGDYESWSTAETAARLLRSMYAWRAHRP